MSELAGTDFMINSMESKMLWWHFNSWATDLKVSETGSRGLAHKLHDNVDPTQGGDLLFIFKSLAYLRIDVFHHAGRDIFIAFWAMAEWYMPCEWAESAIRTLSQLLPPGSHINQFTMESLLPWKWGSLQWKHCISKKDQEDRDNLSSWMRNTNGNWLFILGLSTSLPCWERDGLTVVQLEVYH